MCACLLPSPRMFSRSAATFVLLIDIILSAMHLHRYMCVVGLYTYVETYVITKESITAIVVAHVHTSDQLPSHIHRSIYVGVHSRLSMSKDSGLEQCPAMT